VIAPQLTSSAARWAHRGLKASFVLFILVLPLYSFWSTERSSAGAQPVLGEWKLAKLEVDGRAVTPETGEVQYLTLVPRVVPAANGEGWTVPCSVTLIGGTNVMSTATLTTGHVTFDPSTVGNSVLLKEPLDWMVAEEELRLERSGLQATLRPAAHDYLLARRGFHWINEHPYNR
jgi:hypothetical protein